MNTSAIILTALGIYSIVMIIIGLLSAKNEDAEGFVIGNRNVGIIPTMGSLSSGFRDGGGIVFWVGAGATFMFGGLWLFLGVLISVLFIAYIGPSVRKRSIEHDYITIGQMIKNELGKRTEKTTSILVATFSLLMVGLQLYVSGNLISSISSLSAEMSILLVAITVASYLLIGGYANVIKTDAIQFFLILSLVCLPFLIEIDLSPFFVAENYTSYGTSMNIALFLIGVFYMTTSSDSWQRLFSAKSDKVIRTAFPLSSVMLLFMTVSLFFLGMAANKILPEDTDWGNAFFVIFEQNALPPYVLAYIAVVCIAITMSTLDTLSYLCASTFLKNIAPARITSERKNYVRATRISLGTILIIAILLANVIDDVVKYMFDAISLLYILAPIYIMAGLGWLRKCENLDLMVTVSTILSVVTYIYMFQAGYFVDLIMTFVPMAINFILCASAVALEHLREKNA